MPTDAEPTTIAELTPDVHNRRTHTPRNLAMLADALRDVGASRSIVIDEHGVILAGNGVVEAASREGLTRLRVVDVDGDTVVAVRRRGLTDEQKRALALYDNRAGELAAWNWPQLAADRDAGLTLQPWFGDGDVDKHTGLPDDAPNAEPAVDADVRVEILCGRADLDAFRATLVAWGARDGVMVSIAE